MDFPTILSAIGSIGFPIIACIGIAWFFNRVNENYRTDLKEMNTQHKEEMKLMTDAINNNTLVLQRLCDRMDMEMEDTKNEDSK